MTITQCDMCGEFLESDECDTQKVIHFVCKCGAKKTLEIKGDLTITERKRKLKKKEYKVSLLALLISWVLVVCYLLIISTKFTSVVSILVFSITRKILDILMIDQLEKEYLNDNRFSFGAILCLIPLYLVLRFIIWGLNLN
ncbi:MAG: hypothetical protein GY714_12345 [Desulfobacterales bacterium]|nr:hypothetical protein [Desulfobacterales bacterium]